MARLLLVQSLFVEQFGIMTLAAVAKTKGHAVVVAIGSDSHILNKAREFKPDVVGFSVLTGYQTRYLKLGKSLTSNKNAKPIILFGGPHASFFPQVVLEEGVDVVCRGEGEGALLDILDAVDNNNELVGIENTSIIQNGELNSFPMRPPVDLDEIPFPDQ